MEKSNTLYRAAQAGGVVALIVFVAAGVYGEYRLAQKIGSFVWLTDYAIYERALSDAIHLGNPYAVLRIPISWLYPPQGILIIHAFSLIRPEGLKAALYVLTNLGMMAASITLIARHYGRTFWQTWWWYALCFGFAPFMEMVQFGQINGFAVFGIALMYAYENKNALVSGAGLALSIITKLSPVVLMGYLVVRWKPRVMFWCIVAVAAATALTLLVYRGGPFRAYPGALNFLFNETPTGFYAMSLYARLSDVADPQGAVWLRVLPAALASSIRYAAGFITAETWLFNRIWTITLAALMLISGLLAIRNKQREPLFIVACLGAMIMPNNMSYHHYMFMLIPMLVWMAWARSARVTAWVFGVLFLIQIDRWLLTGGLLSHVVCFASILVLVMGQMRKPKTEA